MSVSFRTTQLDADNFGPDCARKLGLEWSWEPQMIEGEEVDTVRMGVS